MLDFDGTTHLIKDYQDLLFLDGTCLFFFLTDLISSKQGGWSMTEIQYVQNYLTLHCLKKTSYGHRGSFRTTKLAC